MLETDKLSNHIYANLAHRELTSSLMGKNGPKNYIEGDIPNATNYKIKSFYSQFHNYQERSRISIHIITVCTFFFIADFEFCAFHG